ncbi:MAG TPA: hypothetical protein VLF66_01795 [Thermoanaerobaculia bacterium]|nr:hypothetical protein [Thermoanaerobaculia bacterium]
MSLAAYKLLHVAGAVFLFAALGGSVLVHWSGGASDRARKVAGITHGLALLLVAVAGFGALARFMGDATNQLSYWEFWLWGKILIWFLLGGAPFLLRKKPQLAGVFWWLLPLLGAAAAWLALYKPVW